jgi:hypothetical protein
MILRSTPWISFTLYFALLSVLVAAIGGCASKSTPEFATDVAAETVARETAEADAREAAKDKDSPPAGVASSDTPSSQQVTATTVTLASDHPNAYTVQRGDTLWDISARFLDDPWLWPEVWYVNPEIENPHLIYPGDIIELTVGADGRPQLQLRRGRETIKLSPEIRSTSLREAIPPLPLSKVKAFLGNSVVLDDAAWEGLPYVIAQNDGLMINAGDRFYASQLVDPQQSYGVFRKDQPFIDPMTGDYLGTSGLYLGTAVLDSTGELATLSMVKSSREALPGDRLYPVLADLPEAFYPQPGAVNGRIISVLDGVSLIGLYANVVINRGIDDGVEPGQVMGIVKAGTAVLDPYDDTKVHVLPGETSGYLMIYSVFDRVSYGLVMTATRTMRINDLVVPPSEARR